MCKTDTVIVNNIEMKYASFGNGSNAFVIIPGLSIKNVTDSAEAVAKAYNKLEKDYTVYLFDRRTNINTGYSIRDMADDTAAAMKKLGIKNADIFGASQGGMIAMYLAVHHPELVHKLVLGSTAARMNEGFRLVSSEWLRLAKEKKTYALAASFADRMYSEETLNKYRDAIIGGNSDCSEKELSHFTILAEALNTLSIYDDLDEIKCPTLVIGSEGDKVVGADAQREIAEKIGCKLFLYEPIYGHAVYDEAPDYIDRILVFLNNR